MFTILPFTAVTSVMLLVVYYNVRVARTFLQLITTPFAAKDKHGDGSASTPCYFLSETPWIQ